MPPGARRRRARLAGLRRAVFRRVGCADPRARRSGPARPLRAGGTPRCGPGPPPRRLAARAAGAGCAAARAGLPAPRRAPAGLRLPRPRRSLWWPPRRRVRRGGRALRVTPRRCRVRRGGRAKDRGREAGGAGAAERAGAGSAAPPGLLPVGLQRPPRRSLRPQPHRRLRPAPPDPRSRRTAPCVRMTVPRRFRRHCPPPVRRSACAVAAVCGAGASRHVDQLPVPARRKRLRRKRSRPDRFRPRGPVRPRQATLRERPMAIAADCPVRALRWRRRGWVGSSPGPFPRCCWFAYRNALPYRLLGRRVRRRRTQVTPATLASARNQGKRGRSVPAAAG